MFALPFFFPLDPEKHGTDILHHSGQYDLRQMMGGLAIVDDLGTSSGCSFPVEESGGRDTAGSTREASESLGSHNNTESSPNMGNKDEACKDQNSAFDQSSVRAEEISALKGGKITHSPLLCKCLIGTTYTFTCVMCFSDHGQRPGEKA